MRGMRRRGGFVRRCWEGFVVEPRHLGVEAVATRLRTLTVPAAAGWVQVVDAPEDALLAPTLPGPGLRVCLGSVRPSRTPGLLPGGWRVSVVSVFAEVRDVAPSARADTEAALRAAVDAALTDWRPNAQCGPMAYDGGRRLSVAPGLAVQQDDYRAECVTE
jgi:hypothetical protein